MGFPKDNRHRIASKVSEVTATVVDGLQRAIIELLAPEEETDRDAYLKAVADVFREINGVKGWTSRTFPPIILTWADHQINIEITATSQRTSVLVKDRKVDDDGGVDLFA